MKLKEMMCALTALLVLSLMPLPAHAGLRLDKDTLGQLSIQDLEDMWHKARKSKNGQLAEKSLKAQDIRELVDGKVNLPDEVTNDLLQKQLEKSPKVKAVAVHSRKNGRLDIQVDTDTKLGSVKLSGTIENFVVNKDEAYAVYRIKGKKLLNHGGLTGWLFSNLSLSLLNKWAGHVDLENLPVKVDGNTVRVDFRDALLQSDYAKKSVGGYKLLDVLRINGAKPVQDNIQLQTDLDVPDSLKEMLKGYVK